MQGLQIKLEDALGFVQALAATSLGEADRLALGESRETVGREHLKLEKRIAHAFRREFHYDLARPHTKRPKSTSIHQSRKGASTSGSQKVSSWPSIAFAASAELVPAARIPPGTPSPDTKFGASSTAFICSRMRCGRTPSGPNCTVPAAISHSAQSPSSTATRSDSMRNPWGHAATPRSAGRKQQATTESRDLFLPLPADTPR